MKNKPYIACKNCRFSNSEATHHAYTCEHPNAIKKNEITLCYKLSSRPLWCPEAVPCFHIPSDDRPNPYAKQVGGDHYKDKYPFCEPLEFFSKNKIPHTKANVCKYVLRHDSKNGIEDLKKAKHFLEIIAWDEYGVKI